MTGPAIDRVGQVLLGKLRVVRQLGEGATSVVYEVEHLLTKHRRALKVLRPELSRSGEAVARLVREAGAAGRIRSPFVAETFDVGRLPDGATYVLSELLAGETLRALLDREGRLPAARVVELAMQLCEGLAAVHAAGIVHRDIKPENLILTARAEGPDALRIVDFGAMGLPSGPDTLGKLTSAGAAFGTPRYMSPEQIEGAEADARTDVYAAGVILFEALAGGRPFEEETAAALVRAIVSGEAPSLAVVAPDVDADLAAIVLRAMHRDREARFATASDLQRALGEWAARHGDAASPFPKTSALARKYDVVRCLASGGMGAVYEAIHRDTRRRCAIKVMLPALVASEGARERFAREARVAAAIESEAIVEVLDAGVDAESRTPYLVMELLRGEELGSLVTRRRNLSPEDVVDLLAQAAGALDKAHAAGVVHRDLKPENLFVTSRDDGTARLKILDFGIAKVAGDAAGVATGAPLGTPMYMAPEQLEAGVAVGPRADLYALAQVAFTLLAGAPYWADEARAGLVPLFAKVLAGAREAATARAARSGVTLPDAFDPWFTKATAVAAEERFASAREQVAALEAALGLAPGGAGAEAAVESPRALQGRTAAIVVAGAEAPRARWRRTAAIVVAAALLLLVGVFVGRADDTKAPSGDTKASSGDTKASSGDTKASDPVSGAPSGDAKASEPGARTPAEDMSASTRVAKVSTGDTKASDPVAKVSTNDPKVSTDDPKVAVPVAKASLGDPKASLGDPKASSSASAAPAQGVGTAPAPAAPTSTRTRDSVF